VLFLADKVHKEYKHLVVRMNAQGALVKKVENT
jgi:hypothetical protein